MNTRARTLAAVALHQVTAAAQRLQDARRGGDNGAVGAAAVALVEATAAAQIALSAREESPKERHDYEAEDGEHPAYQAGVTLRFRVKSFEPAPALVVVGRHQVNGRRSREGA